MLIYEVVTFGQPPYEADQDMAKKALINTDSPQLPKFPMKEESLFPTEM